MPKVIKKKPVKKKPAQETEVKTVALEALELMKKKRNQAIIIISSIAAVVLILIGFKFYTSSQNQKALSFEMEANSYYYRETPHETLPDSERWEKARDLYQRSIDVKVTPGALFYLGNTYYNLGDYENAIKQYTLFTEKFSSDDALLPIVYQKLTSAYFNAGKNDRALEALGHLAKIKNRAFGDTALLMEAKYYERTGDITKAQEKYKTLASEYPESPWAREATAKIAQQSKPEGKTTPEQTPGKGTGKK